MQPLQPYFKTDSMRNFMYTKHNRGNAKLRIFSFIPQRQRIQPNFMHHKYQTTKQNPNNQNNDTNAGFMFKFWNKSTNFVQFCALHRSPKACTWLDERFRTFHPSLHESLTKVQIRLPQTQQALLISCSI